MNTCHICKLEIEGEPVRRRRVGTYPPEVVFLHETCAAEHERAAQERERQREIERLEREAALALKRRLRAFKQSFADSRVGASGNPTSSQMADLRPWLGDDYEEEAYAHGPLQFPTWNWSRFGNAEFRRRADPRMFAAAESYDEKATGSLVLCGKTGSAKSASSCAWIWRRHDELKARVEAGESLAMSFAWISGFELAGARKRSPLGEEARLVRLAIDAQILVLDEVGQEPRSEETFVVLDARYRDNKSTILTSPLESAALMNHLGGGAYRRLLEHGALVEAFGEAPRGKATVRVVR